MKPLRVAAPGALLSGCARQAVLAPASDQASVLHGLLEVLLVVCNVSGEPARRPTSPRWTI